MFLITEMHTQCVRGGKKRKIYSRAVTLTKIQTSSCLSINRNTYHSVVVRSWLMTPETIGPRIIARPCPANPKDTNLTPRYSVGIIVLFSGFCKKFSYCHNWSLRYTTSTNMLEFSRSTISSSWFSGETIVGKLGP